MISTRTNDERFRLLGLLRTFLIQAQFEALYSNDESGEHLAEFQEYFEGFVLAASEIGLEINPTAVLPHIQKYEQFVEFILENTILDEALSVQISDQFGNSAQFNFMLAQALTTVRLLGSFRWSRGVRLSDKRRKFVNTQIAIAHDALSGISMYLKDQLEGISNLFGISYSERCNVLAEALLKTRRSIKRFAIAHDLTETLLNDLIPNFGEISERRDRARELLGQLTDCPSGRTAWRKYEDICIKCVRFLFSPPFKSIHVQQRTEDNHERRDAILTNNEFGGFWRLIREEFESRHVVCEFKNKSSHLSKNDLNQLRIYLSNPR